MFNSNYPKRAKRRVNVLRGFDGADPSTFTRVAAVASAHAAGGGDEIVSGELVSFTTGEWVKGCPAGQVPYIALSDTSDHDVKSSGLLPALSCAGKFEIETAIYDGDDTYNEETPIVAGATAGEIAAGALDGTADIIGFASRGGETDLNGGLGPKIEVNAEDGNIVTFITNWTPLNVVA